MNISFFAYFSLTIQGLKRDKILWSLAAAAIIMVALVPVLSLLSMRQVQELSVTLSLSCTSFFLLICTVFLGAASIWRDLEKRFAVAVLTLPISRQQFIFAKFFALGSFLIVSLVVLSLLGAIGVVSLVFHYPSERNLNWFNYFLAFGMIGIKYLLLLSLSLTLSTLTTSFFLPIFGTISLFLAGSASHQVVAFISENPDNYSYLFVKFLSFIQYLIPNFSAFDYQVYAIYGLPLSWEEVAWAFIYGVLYITVSLMLAGFFFKRREI